jgi:hypothetical protein
MTEQEALLVLNAIPNLGPSASVNLWHFLAVLWKSCRHPVDELTQCGLISPTTAENIFHFSKDKFLQDEYNLMQRKGIVAITAADDQLSPAL